MHIKEKPTFFTFLGGQIQGQTAIKRPLATFNYIYRRQKNRWESFIYWSVTASVPHKCSHVQLRILKEGAPVDLLMFSLRMKISLLMWHVSSVLICAHLDIHSGHVKIWDELREQLSTQSNTCSCSFLNTIKLLARQYCSIPTMTQWFSQDCLVALINRFQ